MNPQALMNRLSALSMQPMTRQLSLLLGLAASIALGIWLVQWAMTPDYTPLYGQLSPNATTEVIRSLESNGIKYRFDSRNGLVAVPADQVYDTRLKLASQGLPEGDSAGFDTLYREQEIGLSSFMEKARYDRALEYELARSITSLDSVKSARVHLALPKESAFLRKKNKPAASVLLNLFGGRQLTDSQLAGVIHLVASSVPGLAAEDVSVVDNQGRLLSTREPDSEFAKSKEQISYTRQLEGDYAERIVDILTPILGMGAVKAQVSADVDFTSVEKTSEVYDPESSLRSEQVEEESSESNTVGGIPGTLANQPPPPTQVTDTPPEENTSAQGRISKRQIKNYELDKTISHIREAPGSLKRISVAVVVDYQDQVNAEGQVERTALNEAQIGQITALVKEAVGFDEERGDSVNVVNASFVSTPEMELAPEPSLLEQPWVWQVAKLLLAAITLIVVILLVIRPLMQASAAAPPALAYNRQPQGGSAAYGSEGEQGLREDQVTLGYQQQPGLPGSTYQQQLSMARSLVEKEPERVAHVVKNWVTADG